jgi:hypothetical protein
MSSLPHVDLVARRARDLHDGRPDYIIVAGGQVVGRMYLTQLAGAREAWEWAINTVLTDNRIGVPLTGFGEDFGDARRQFRIAFEAWLAWALAIPDGDLKRAHIDRNLKAIGVR